MSKRSKAVPINFFQSPHPLHFDFRSDLLLDDIHDPSPLFFPRIFAPDLQLCAGHPICRQQSRSPQGSVHSSMSPQEKEQQIQVQGECLGIDEKIEFSNEIELSSGEENLFSAVTPKKQCLFPSEHTQYQTTVRKLSDSKQSLDAKYYERGLKKLAFEAYLFVISQRRTSYKDVARKLIDQMAQQGSVAIQKRGEMNVKRRAYDALNVLIAVGLLKRNGNKIIAKRSEKGTTLIQGPSGQPCADPRDLELYEEVMELRSEVAGKQSDLRNKQQRLQKLQQQLSALACITEKNRTRATKSAAIIPMPFFALCGKDVDRGFQQEKQVSLWQQDGTVICSADPARTHLMGDLDCLAYYDKAKKPPRPQKHKKGTNRPSD